MTRIFTGFDLAAEINAGTRALITDLGRRPRCTVLFDGGNAGMAAYASRQATMAADVGITLSLEPYPQDAGAVMARLAALRADPMCDAAATLYPLPPGVAPAAAAAALGAARDIDGLHPLNAGVLALGHPTGPPATAAACRLIARALVGSLKGAEIVLVGASRIVGRPLAHLLLDDEATVTIAHAATRDLQALTARADIVITAAGVAGLIGTDHIRAGAVLIDVAIIRTAAGLVGDVDRAAVSGKAGVVTHVPDGVGPVTTACLMRNITQTALAGAGG